MAITTQDIRNAATDTAYAAAGAADLTAEKLGQLLTEAPERFEQLKKTDPKVVQERVARQAKEAQATLTAKFTEIVGSLDSDVKNLGQTAQDLALKGVGQAVGYAAAAGEQFEKLAERGRTAVKQWRGDVADEFQDIAVAIEPEAETAGPEAGKPSGDQAAAEDKAAGDKPAGASGDAAADDAGDKPAAARKAPAKKTAAAKKTDAKTGE
ncbi:hypothetical protein FGW37_18790 [Streptomyces rectiverticillatus]|uniref:hypothetical protein n=1 Tax=Streptomyces rectiverticillatus TaxID=173860 RepID=UPI0015C37C28|nr:hypothetical protein [Streptomyces rectiverticillatus]QLE73358.1 hypothetical protein FGW37_18790 [Streptomyces rectiverticillatus]